MIDTLDALSGFLGQRSTTLLACRPFTLWRFVRKVHREVHRIDYVCDECAIDIVGSEEDDCIEAIFLNFDDPHRSPFIPQDFALPLSRQTMLDQFGTPSSSGPKSVGLIGKSGRWDRYDQESRVIHFQFECEADRVTLITLMWPASAP